MPVALVGHAAEETNKLFLDNHVGVEVGAQSFVASSRASITSLAFVFRGTSVSRTSDTFID